VQLPAAWYQLHCINILSRLTWDFLLGDKIPLTINGICHVEVQRERQTCMPIPCPSHAPSHARLPCTYLYLYSTQLRTPHPLAPSATKARGDPTSRRGKGMSIVACTARNPKNVIFLPWSILYSTYLPTCLRIRDPADCYIRRSPPYRQPLNIWRRAKGSSHLRHQRPLQRDTKYRALNNVIDAARPPPSNSMRMKPCIASPRLMPVSSRCCCPSCKKLHFTIFMRASQLLLIIWSLDHLF
jgi:hypothetical protein